MTDKERILTEIIRRFYPSHGKCQTSSIKKGDLVLCKTSGIHEFTIGYVNTIFTDSSMVIREIGTKNLCRISNEIFYKIDINIKDPCLLTGLNYKTYIKVLKAIKKATDYYTRYHSIEFKNNQCTFHLRESFSLKITKTFTFKYSSRTTIKEIKNLIEGG